MNTVLVLFVLSLFTSVVFGKEYPNSSSFYGCPDECDTQEAPKCEIDLPKHFVALHPDYFKTKVNGNFKYCGHYYVGMTVDTERADGKYKMIRAKVVDQCGSCAKSQVDLNQPTFELLAQNKHGIIKMIYVILGDDNEIMDGPVYSGSALSALAEVEGVSESEIRDSFVEAAKEMNENKETKRAGYPWKSGSSSSNKKSTTTKKRTTTTKKRTTTTKKRTTTTTKKRTTTTTKKRTTTKKTTTTKRTTTTSRTTTSKRITTTVIVKPTTVPVVVPTSVVQSSTIIQTSVINTSTVIVPVVSTTSAINTVISTTTIQQPKPTSIVKPKYDTEKDTDVEGGSSTAKVLGLSAAVVGAAGIGLMMLKRKSPQKYNDLKQKFPEAFTTVKRGLSRGATTIKRGVTRTQRKLSRRGTRTGNNRNAQEQPIPASYSFTLNSEDGLPRVALYDDPYPTKTTGGNQHW